MIKKIVFSGFLLISTWVGYAEHHTNWEGLDPHILKAARVAYYSAKAQGQVKKPIVSIVDYSLPSNKKRLWIIDLSKNRLLYHLHVTHGQGSGGRIAQFFSDQPGSHASSLGVFVTQESYVGQHGLSMRINGLEPRFNAHARARAIVVHGANYATANFAEAYGRLGRSFGCLAISPRKIRSVIKTLKNGSLVFAYYPDRNWLKHSRYLSDL